MFEAKELSVRNWLLSFAVSSIRDDGIDEFPTIVSGEHANRNDFEIAQIRHKSRQIECIVGYSETGDSFGILRCDCV